MSWSNQFAGMVRVFFRGSLSYRFGTAACSATCRKRLNNLLVVNSAIHQTAYNHQTPAYVKKQITIVCTTSPRTKDLRFSGFCANNVSRDMTRPRV